MAITKANRKAAVDFFLNHLKSFKFGKKNYAIYEEFFKKASDDHLETMAHRIKAGNLLLPVFVKNMDSVNRGSFEEVIRICKRNKIPLFERIIITDAVTGETVMPPNKALILGLTARRQIHHLLKKISLPEHDNVIDNLSGQVTGESKGASLTHPEATALDGKGYKDAVIELKKLRGSDPDAFDLLTRQLEETGSASMVPILDEGTVSQNLASLQYYLLGMNIDNNAIENRYALGE